MINEKEVDYLVGATKCKFRNDNKDERNADKRIHKTLKDNPKFIIIPSLRKQREREMEESNISNKILRRIKPSILTQPRIEKKEIERKICNNERANSSNDKSNDSTNNNSLMNNKVIIKNNINIDKENNTNI